MANRVTAQKNLNNGSFIMARSNDGHLIAGRMYRIRYTKNGGKYVVLDTNFCGTKDLNGKTIKFEDNFYLMTEQQCKTRFKAMLQDNGFVAGNSFNDVRYGDIIHIDKNSRTHILAKFGQFMGVKIAGGHVWFAGKEWATARDGDLNDVQPKKNLDEQIKDEQVQDKRRPIVLGKGTIEEQILALVQDHLQSPQSRKDMGDAVEKLLNHWGIDKNVREVVVTNPVKKEKIKVGKVHNKFDLVLSCMAARTNIALVGAAGSGKTTTVAKAAQALGLEFYSKSVSAQTGIHEFFGYQDANGNYVTTLFRTAYEKGGVFLLDEFDAGNPNVLAALNQATANDSCAFADGMIPKHKDFICVMAGNTFGHGANSEYVGRNKIDAATLDRFAFIDFPYDEDLEYALATNKDWCRRVQAFRRKVADKKVKTIISPRATIIGCQLLSAGIKQREVEELVIYKGLSKTERNLIIQ